MKSIQREKFVVEAQNFEYLSTGLGSWRSERERI